MTTFSPDIKQQNDLCGGSDARNHPNDHLELYASPADLPSVFRGVHEL